jgi:diguanylate cyclase (GGDEF)-like protein
MPTPQLSPRKAAYRVYALSAVLAVAAGVVFGTVDVRLDPIPAPVEVPWLALVAAFAVAEIFVVHLHIRRDSHSFSLSEVPLIVGLIFVAPVALITARTVGALAALLLHRRQRGVKLAFNIAHFTLETCLAVAIFRTVLGDADPSSWRGWLAALVVTMTTDLLSGVYLATAISLHEGRFVQELLREAATFGVISAAVNTSLAILAVTVLWHQATAAWALGVVVLLAVVTYRSYISLREGHGRLEVLYSFTKDLEHSAEFDQLAGSILERTREVMRAERAELVLLSAPGAPGVRVELSGDGLTVREMAGDSGLQWWSGALSDRPVFIPRASQSADIFKDAMAAPLVDGAVIGVLVVVDRSGDVDAFNADDLKLFETIANHASVTLQNGRLINRLRERAAENEHQAMHDTLTGLPNRRMFQAVLDGVIAADPAAPAVVLLMDLDRFKEVNDSLGHAIGDQLLVEAGERLRARVGERGVVARLGGDEYCVVLPGTTRQRVAAVAAELLQCFELPFRLGDLSLSVAVSIGITIAPEHGTDTTILLQRADVAMYIAKANLSGVEVYEASRDQHSSRRLALSGDLHGAIEAGQLVVHYQPKVAFVTGAVVGAEALVRWQHPSLGFIPPDEFIPLAEQTALIRPLTAVVLEAALRASAGWREDAGLRIPGRGEPLHSQPARRLHRRRHRISAHVHGYRPGAPHPRDHRECGDG